jgi:hypothetical protein
MVPPEREAVMSGCGKYRYLLRRRVGRSHRVATIIMLNPSTADAVKDDPTIRRCMGFARLWGCSRLQIVNLFALRSRDPEAIQQAADPVGPENEDHIRRAIETACRGPIVCAWGVRGSYRDRDLAMLRMLRQLGVRPLAIAVTRGGYPRHPLYAAYTRRLVSLEEAWPSVVCSRYSGETGAFGSCAPVVLNVVANLQSATTRRSTPMTRPTTRSLLAVGCVLAMAVRSPASSWQNYPQSVIGSHAPIIVLGEIVAVDVAKGQEKELGTLRFLDRATIRVERVYKNALSDLAVKDEIGAYMHSTDMSVPGSSRKGEVQRYSTSRDLRYRVGTRGVWFLFLTPEGNLVIHRHPQQLLPLEKGAKAPETVALGTVGETFSRKEWMTKDRSNLNPGKRDE